MIFDDYTKSIVSTYLTEAAGNTVWVDPKTKKRYIIDAQGNKKLYPVGSTIKKTGGIQTSMTPSSGFSPAEPTESGYPVEKFEDMKTIEDVPGFVKKQVEEYGKTGDEAKKYASLSTTAFMTGGNGYRSGFDPYAQTAWVNLKGKSEEIFKMLDSTAASGLSGGFNLLGQAVPAWAQGFFQTAAGAASLASRQISAAAKNRVRKQLAKLYLGMAKPDEKLDFGDPTANAIWDATKDYILPTGTNLADPDRFGDFGARVYGQLEDLTAAGEDPLEAALNVTGAPKAVEAIKKQFSVGPAALETSAGYLSTGRKQGIYK